LPRGSQPPSSSPPRSTVEVGRAAERQARRHYRLRGWRILAVNARPGRNELDLVVRRGRKVVFCEVKAKSGDRFGDPADMVGPEKQQRLRRAATAWLAAHPELGAVEVGFEVVAVRAGRLERLRDAF
jgi:putative endonuclease